MVLVLMVPNSTLTLPNLFSNIKLFSVSKSKKLSQFYLSEHEQAEEVAKEDQLICLMVDRHNNQ